ncbi:hypothetical protein GCM10010398_62750 [Streptomyces fimbriatus]
MSRVSPSWSIARAMYASSLGPSRTSLTDWPDLGPGGIPTPVPEAAAMGAADPPRQSVRA